MIIDTHSHCYWKNLAPRLDEIIANMRISQVQKAVQIGCDIPTSQQAIDLAKRFPQTFFATVGIHPETAQDEIFSRQKLESYENLITKNRDVVVAIGECGLDFHYLDGSDGGTKKVDFSHLSAKAIEQIRNQKDWWFAEWQLAQKYHLPLVIHSRDARDETLHFMLENNITRAVMHCYAEDVDMARALMDFSDEIYFSFSGILTYKNALAIQETARMLPLQKILVETDAPFLAPQPVRGQVCEPAFTRYTLEKLIELRDESAEEIEKTVYENSGRFYGVG